MFSVIIPVYRNEEFVPLLMQEFAKLSRTAKQEFGQEVEFVFVVDASPDRSYERLEQALPEAPFRSQLVLHARNFGSFAAIRSGLHAARGEFFGVIAADLQEPPELLLTFLRNLIGGEYDLVVGVREGRDDPVVSRASANAFWSFYRRFVNKEIPIGGVDVFGCNKRIRDELLRLEESNSSLIGQLFWLGFRRKEVGYLRRPRAHGRSAWTLAKKVTYLLDSIFAFTDMPIRVLGIIGVLGIVSAVALGVLVAMLRLMGNIAIPGYSATIVVITFFGALNTLGISLVGVYAWRAYENTKRRPLALVRHVRSFEGAPEKAQERARKEAV